MHVFRLSWYDYVCLGLLLLIGLGCITITLLARLAGIDLISTSKEDEFNALYSSILLVGILSTGFVSIILLLLRDRRRPGSDRRQSQQSIDFPDRRRGMPRRRTASHPCDALTSREMNKWMMYW